MPIEVEPLAASVVLTALRALGSTDPKVRTGPMSKAGPLKTDQGNFIIDAPFQTLLLPQDKGATEPGHGKGWEVETLAKEIKLIEGVLSVGIFCGENGLEAAQAGRKTGGQKPIAAYFGMEDGGVVVRTAGSKGISTQEVPVK